MRNLSALLVITLLMVVFTSCEKIIGEGGLVNETRTTASFSGIESELSGDVVYTKGNEYKVELTAQRNILDVLETPVVNNKLIVRFKNNVRVKSHEPITIKVTAPSLSSIGSSGSGNVMVLSPVTSSDLSLRLSGSGNLDLSTIDCSSIEANISGSGNISITGGTVDGERLKISGSGKIDAENVQARSAVTTTSGSGSIRLSASETLDVTISGSGSVYYRGTPAVTTHISGSGRVIHQ